MSRRNRRTPAAGFSIAALQVLIAGVCWFPCRVMAADVSAPWFHATFDGTQKVTQAGKEAYPVTRVELKYDEGPVGKGIVLAPMGQQLVYRQGEFPLAAGTIALWVKPLLDPNDYSVFFIFAKSSDDGSYDCPNDRTWIYLTSSPTLGRVLRVYMTDDKNSYGTTLEWAVTPETWKVGQWKHLAWTWDDGVTTLYIDG
ncbi:MAG: hypothetical protein HY318_16720, partial [Armatimonadetes bacterium]|nr:hypothetical protein [Armatimonadota bacterium]